MNCIKHHNASLFKSFITHLIYFFFDLSENFYVFHSFTRYAFKIKKSICISAVEVVAPVAFVTTIANEPAEAVELLMHSPAPVVAPLMLNITSVVDAVIDELVIVKVKSAAAAIE